MLPGPLRAGACGVSVRREGAEAGAPAGFAGFGAGAAHDRRLWRVLLRVWGADPADQCRYALAGRGARGDLQRDPGHCRRLGIVAGRVLDRRGPRLVFLFAAVAGTGVMLAASAQSALLPFAIAYASGCGLVGALGFYHITQAAAARVLLRANRS